MPKGQTRPPFADRLYALLLRLLPFDFRSEFGSDMEETFRQQWAETRREQGPAALLKMWWDTILDLVQMAPREHLGVLALDARYALRMMRQNLSYTTAAVIVLGLGIGANTSIFSVVNSVLLKPLPYAQGDGLVVLHQSASRLGLDGGFSVPEIEDYRRGSRSLNGMVEYHSMVFTLLGRTEAHRVRTGVVSAGFFDLFGVQPLLGRTFVAADERPGAPPVLVLSYEYWKQGESGDPNIVGKVFEMNDKPHQVVGVLPPIPQYPRENDVYMPTSACPFRSNPANISKRGYRLMTGLFGRLKPGATLDLCRKDVSMVAGRMAADHPETYPERLGFQAGASDLRNELTMGARPMLLVLLGASAFVLLIACANVANLILARMAGREQELAIRTAVGAGSGRLLRQLLTENLILALLAAAVGLLFATGSLDLLTRFAGQLTPRAREIAMDGRVLAFAILCAAATNIAFGSAAAWHSRKQAAPGAGFWALKEGSRAAIERRRWLFRSALIASQVAFSYILLIGAGLMVRSFIQLNRVDPGYVPQRVYAVGFGLNWSKYTQSQPALALADRLLEKVRRQPGVLSAAVANSFPMDPDLATFGNYGSTMRVEGDPRSETELPVARSIRSVSPDYFRTLGIPLVAGRGFLDSDTDSAPPVAILNHALAVQIWGNRNPLGRRISLDDGQNWREIVGVAGDTREFGLDRESPAQFYRPMTQNPSLGSILVRTAGESPDISGLMRRAVLDLDPQTAIVNVETLEQARADSVASPRNTTRLFGLFALLAFLIAVTGIGSMLALWVRQRTREIGIRMALGARPRDILRTVIRQGMLLVGIGLAIGLGGAVALTRFLRAFLFHVQPTDAATYALVSALLSGAALAACYVPARKAARIDPQSALRCD